MIRVNSFFQMLFLLFILAMAIISRVQFYPIEWYSTILILFLPILLLKRNVDMSKKKIFLIFTFLVIWGLFSTIWCKNIEYYSYLNISTPLFCAFLTMAIPYIVTGLVINKNGESNNFITSVTVILSIILLYYIYMFYHNPLRDSGGRFIGKIGGAAVLHIFMVPALAVSLTNFIEKQKRFISIVCISITVISLFLTGSRAALISLVLFIVFLILKNVKSIKRLLIILIPISLISFIIIQYAPNQRYQNLDDQTRTISGNTAITAATHSASSFIFGNGFGSLWPYYAEVQQGDDTQLLHTTDYGMTLIHPHSVFYEVFGEFGIIGTIALFLILYYIVKELLKSIKAKNHMRSNMLGAALCTVPALCVDLYFFNNWPVSLIWWFYLFAALSYKPTNSTKYN